MTVLITIRTTDRGCHGTVSSGLVAAGDTRESESKKFRLEKKVIKGAITGKVIKWDNNIFSNIDAGLGNRAVFETC